MTSRPASRILAALVYAQVLLCLAGVASVLVRHNADQPQLAKEIASQDDGTVAARI